MRRGVGSDFPCNGSCRGQVAITTTAETMGEGLDEE